jgi:hypothetical protein
MTTIQKEVSVPTPEGYVEVVALTKGSYGKGRNVSRIRQGETFFVPIGSKCATWFEPVNPADMAKLLPNGKAEKQRRKEELNRATREASDPAVFLQSMRQALLQGMALPIPPGKVLEIEQKAAKVTKNTAGAEKG